MDMKGARMSDKLKMTCKFAHEHVVETFEPNAGSGEKRNYSLSLHHFGVSGCAGSQFGFQL